MSGIEKFNFTAPQFVESLGDGDLDDGADNFFDAHDSVVPNVASSAKNIDSEEISGSCEITTSHINTQPNDDVMNEECNDENKEPWSKKSQGRGPRLQRMSVKKVTPQSRKNSKFMSLAEQVHKFHHGTPPRFKRMTGIYRTRSSKLLPTIAMSPLLHTKARSRASTVQPTTKIERPVLKPLRRSTAKPPPKPAPKPPTVPQPFNLTDVNRFKKTKQPVTNELPDVLRKAKSTMIAKKTALTVPKTGPNPETTEPKPSGSRSPVNLKKRGLKVEGDKVTVTEKWGITGLKTTNKPSTWTEPKPFSFERRNQEYLKAKLQKTKEGNSQQKSPTAQKN